MYSRNELKGYLEKTVKTSAFLDEALINIFIINVNLNLISGSS